VEFELDALAAGDVLDRHLAERRRLVASQARKIDDGEALGRRLDRRGEVKFCPTPPPLAEDDPRPAAPAETNAGAAAMLSFDKFWAPITHAVLAL
jgi:hypothetical protein